MEKFTEKDMMSGMTRDWLKKAGISSFQLFADEDLAALALHPLGWCNLVNEVLVALVETRVGDVPLSEAEQAIAKGIEGFKETGHAWFSGMSRLEGYEGRFGSWTFEIWR